MADDLIDDAIAELSQLRSKLASVDGRLDRQEDVIGSLAEQLEAVAELLGAQEPDFLLSPWWWPDMTRSQAEEAWKTLTEWVDQLIIPRYDDGKNTMPVSGAQVLRPDEVGTPHSSRVLRCWFAHPSAVDRLSALLWAQKGDYRRNAPASAPLEWQENWLPKTLDGLDAEFKRKKCMGTCPHLSGAIAGNWPEQRHESLSLRHRKQWINADIARRPE